MMVNLHQLEVASGGKRRVAHGVFTAQSIDQQVESLLACGEKVTLPALAEEAR